MAINVLPLLLYDVLAGSAISSVLVPPTVRYLRLGQDAAAKRLLANALGLVLGALGFVVVIAIALNGLIASALTAGFDSASSGLAKSTASLLLVLILPQILCYGAIGVFVSTQHAHGKFLVSSMAPIVENLGIIATIVLVARHFPNGMEGGAGSRNAIWFLGIGSGLAVIAHVAVQYVGARWASGGLSLGFDRRAADIKALSSQVKDSFGWSATVAARAFGLIIAAGYAGRGGVQAFELATLAYYIPTALVGRPIAGAALVKLAQSKPGSATFLGQYRSAIRLGAWLCIPAGVGLIALSGALANVMAFGKFASSEPIKMLGYGLAGLGVGAASDALFEISRQTTMAFGNAAGLRKANLARAVSAVVGIPAAVALVDGPALLLALGVVVSMGDVVAFYFVHRGLRREPLWVPDAENHAVGVAIASVIAFVPMALIVRSFNSGQWLNAGAAKPAAVAVAALSIYIGSAWLLTKRGAMIRMLSDSLNRGDLS